MDILRDDARRGDMARALEPIVRANDRAESIVIAFFTGLEKHVRAFFRRLFRRREE